MKLTKAQATVLARMRNGEKLQRYSRRYPARYYFEGAAGSKLVNHSVVSALIDANFIRLGDYPKSWTHNMHPLTAAEFRNLADESKKHAASLRAESERALATAEKAVIRAQEMEDRADELDAATKA